MMLDQLTNYLLQYKTVCIPHVGTLRLVQHPAQLNVADKRLQPPTHVVEIAGEENLSDHQLNFLRGFENREKETVASDLHSFGEAMSQSIAAGGFEWNGLGTFKRDTQTLALNAGSLGPLPAQKIIRQGATHSVLVGDREMMSGQVYERNPTKRIVRKKRAPSVYIGWIILGLSLLLIAVILYLGKFKVNAAGSKFPPTSLVIPAKELPKL